MIFLDHLDGLPYRWLGCRTRTLTESVGAHTMRANITNLACRLYTEVIAVAVGHRCPNSWSLIAALTHY